MNGPLNHRRTWLLQSLRCGAVSVSVFDFHVYKIVHCTNDELHSIHAQLNAVKPLNSDPKYFSAFWRDNKMRAYVSQFLKIRPLLSAVRHWEVSVRVGFTVKTFMYRIETYLIADYIFFILYLLKCVNCIFL